MPSDIDVFEWRAKMTRHAQRVMGMQSKRMLNIATGAVINIGY